MGFFDKFIAFIMPLFGMESPTADIVFAGDAMMHEGQITAARTAGGDYDFKGYFDSIQEYIESADYAVVNFEASLGGKPYRGYPCFSAPDEYAEALTSAGFDFFLLANNHILDRRDKGLHRTINLLDSLQIPHSGVWHNAAARDSISPCIVDVKGFKVAMLNYTYGTNGIEVQKDAVVDYIDFARISSDVKKSREKGAELVAVCIHWGDEYKLLPNATQKQMADKLMTLDVDMIIGGHPHVIQPMEMRTNDDGKPVLLVYSLGNFVSNMKTNDTRGGAMVRVQLARGDKNQAYVASASYSLVFTEPPVDGQNYRVVPAHKATHASASIFRKNAEAIFSKHNKGVPVDSIFMKR